MVLKLEVGGQELYDEESNRFFTINTEVVRFEYTLKAIFEWEGIYKLSWMNLLAKKSAETKHLSKMMELCCLDEWNDGLLTSDNLMKFVDYISTPQTATTIQNEKKSAGGGSYTTSEQIYYIMVTNRIPIELENWNYHRLNALIAIINDARSPKKKRPLKDIYAEQNRINEARLKGKGG